MKNRTQKPVFLSKIFVQMKNIAYFCIMIVLFDLDGTLLHTIDDLGHACNFALQQAGYPVHPVEAFPAMVGNGINMLIRRALPEAERTDETVLRLRQDFVAYYNSHNCDFTHPYDGIPELLDTLKSEGHLLAVASNKYHAASEKIIRHFFPGVFDCVLGEREGVPRKPDPQIVRDILHALLPLANLPLGGLEADCLFVGDSLVDRDTAGNAGIPFVACSWGFVPRADLVAAAVPHIVDSPRQILEFVR